MSTTAIVSALVLVTLFALTDSYGVRGARRAASAARVPLRRHPAWWATTYNGVAIGVLLIAALLRIARYRTVADVAVSGFVVVALAGALRVWSVAHLGRNFTFYVPDGPKAGLVSSGPYGWVRHPIYAAQLGFAAGLLLIARTWGLGLVTIVPLVPALAVLRRHEDALIARQFGEAFVVYRRRTPSLNVLAWCWPSRRRPAALDAGR